MWMEVIHQLNKRAYNCQLRYKYTSELNNMLTPINFDIHIWLVAIPKKKKKKVSPVAQPWTIHFQMQETKETHIWLPGQDDPFFHGEGKDNTFQYSSCIIPWTQKPGAAQSTISKKNQTWLSASNSSRKDYFGAILFSCSVMSDSLRAHESQHTIPPYPLPTPSQIHVHRVGDAIQPSHPLSSPFTPAPNPSHNQGLLQWVKSSH